MRDLRTAGNDRLITRLFFQLLPYQILLLVINAANVIVDSLFAGNFIGYAGMSAIGVYAPFDHLLYAVSMMLVSGSQLLVGKTMGERHVESVRSIFSTDLIVAAAVSGAISLAMLLSAATNLTGQFISNPAELRAVNRYFIGMSLGLPALVMGQQLFAFLSMENQTRRTTAASIACIAVNAAMDVLLVVVLDLDMLGLGLGSAIALWTFFGVMAVFYARGKSSVCFSFRAFRKQDAITIMKRGYPGALSRFVEMFRCFIVNLLIVRHAGYEGLSAFAAVNSVMAVFWPIPFGMVAVARMLLGASIGEEDRRSVTDIMRVGVFRGGLLQCGVTALIILLAVPITRMFYRNPADPVYQMTLSGFRILPLCMPLSVFSLMFAIYTQAADKKPMKVLLPVVDGMAGVVCCSLILIPLLKLTGLYIANVLNGVICFVLIVGFAAAKLWRMPRNMEDLLLFPDDFGVGEDERIDIEVRDMPGVLEVSRQVTAFCEERGIDRRRAAFSGLALEEMAGNVVIHGFEADKKQHFVDIRVAHKGDYIILRLRDNCIPFNPEEKAAIMAPPDEAGNIGIRIAFSIARDVQYRHLLGLNVLTIRL